MDTTLTAMSAAACLAHPVLPPITGASGTALTGARIGALTDLVPGAAIGLVSGSAAAPAYPAEGTTLSTFPLVTDSFTDATQVPPRGRPV